MPMNPRLLRPRAAGSFDPAAQVYFNAVAIADGQQLETAVKKAINDFVVGCKRDGIWSAIKASCILMGARTLSGALTPLVGAAPTNNNFVSGDYNRKTGLVGNGSTKYLNTNRNNNADPQDSKHLAAYKTADVLSATGGLVGSNVVASGASWLFDSASSNADTVRLNAASSVGSQQFPATGFVGASRSSSSAITTRYAGTTATPALTSAAPLDGNTMVFVGAGNQYTSARLSFYSIGESLDLALLDSRVSTLYNAIGAAI